MRIIAGLLKGRRLAGPSGPGLRPTSDRLRETLFNVLGPTVAGVRVLDGFAGTGALGLEAISRGAVHVTFVERDRGAVAVIQANVSHCGVQEACAIVRDDFVTFAASRGAGAPVFDLVFLDPPYEGVDLGAALEAAAALSPGGRLVLEHSRRRETPELVSGWHRTRLLPSGDSALSFYAATPGRSQS